MSKKQMGFTLIEIVMVLVLLGILSAVAVPKYFDLRDQAAQKSAQAVAAEIQARVNAIFAQELLTGTQGCKAARTAVFNTTNMTKIQELGNNISLTAFSEPAENESSVNITFTMSGVTYSSASSTDNLQKVNAITVPLCDKSATRTTTPPTQGEGN